MGELRHFRSAALAVAFAAAFGGLLAAQRTYRGMPMPPPEMPLAEPVDGERAAEFAFARLVYRDLYDGQLLEERPWHIDSPAAERHFLQGIKRLSNVDARPMEVYVKATDDEIFDYPWLYVVEPGHWDLSDEEVERLREYLLRGGFMVLDDFHGSAEWASFMDSMQRIFPDRPVREIGPDDEVFHVLFDVEPDEQIPGIQMLYSGRTFERDGETPHWRGIYDDEGRLMVLINWNMDLGDAWEHADWPDYTAKAYRMGINYVVYAMTH